MPSGQAGSPLPVRALTIGDRDTAIDLSRRLLAEGFYVSPVYFPVTSRGREGLRVLLRANVSRAAMSRFTELLREMVVPHVID